MEKIFLQGKILFFSLIRNKLLNFCIKLDILLKIKTEYFFYTYQNFKIYRKYRILQFEKNIGNKNMIKVYGKFYP